MQKKTRRDKELLESLARLSQDKLDEMVREAKDDEASELNGSGREAQIKYLLGED
jgi:predicted lactoylglutathione lyase